MSAGEEEITRLFRARRTILQMLGDRGFVITDDDINMTREQFIERYAYSLKREDLDMIKVKRDDASDKICVFFLTSDNPKSKLIGITVIKRRIQDMVKEHNATRAILVVEYGLTAPANKSIANDELKALRLETFLDSELQCNVMEHSLVPKHEVLSTSEKNDLLQKYRVKEIQLPRMLASDPVARYFGLQRGHIVKIMRPSETAGKYVTYRYVC